MTQSRTTVAVPASRAPAGRPRTAAFTLIEMSIVLVIIGLIMGGVLVGQSLINAAAVRAQISQIEKYNTAARTFYGKYGYLPGDINAAAAAQFGFAARGPYGGQGDGNGVIQGNYSNAAFSVTGGTIFSGETALFWVDLSAANLVDGSFNTGTATGLPASITGSAIDSYFPQAKIGRGNYIYAYSGFFSGGGWHSNSINYFGVSNIVDAVAQTTNPGLTVMEAYYIDKKIDDGYPQSGAVVARDQCCNGRQLWMGVPFTGTDGEFPSTTATAGSSATCMDNGNVGGAPQQYSVKQNGGAGVNCALSFQFQ